MVEVMARKVKEGVDVRVIYDDFGTITRLPGRYYQKLEGMGLGREVLPLVAGVGPHGQKHDRHRPHRLAPQADDAVLPVAERVGVVDILVGEIDAADKYVYINTPYLILDNEFVTALCLAAESGVDVRITMPHIPDKKLVL